MDLDGKTIVVVGLAQTGVAVAKFCARRGARVVVTDGKLIKQGKRVFLMAPIHHHYEKKGWDEPKIIVRFWLVSALLALIALGTLKFR